MLNRSWYSKKTYRSMMLMVFTWFNVVLLSSLTSDRLLVYFPGKMCRCVLSTSLKIAFDFAHLPLVYTDYPFGVCINDS